MLRRYTAFVFLFRSAGDICMIGFLWLLVFFIRFHSGLFATSKGIPGFSRHLFLTIPVVCICYLSCLLVGLYRPQRVRNLFLQLADTFKAAILGGLFVLAFFYCIQNTPYSRKLLALFIVMLFAGLVFSHLLSMVIMRRLRAKGYNLRYYVVIGAGSKGQQLVQDIEQMGFLGLKCVFFVDNDPHLIGREVLGLPVKGPVEKLIEFVSERVIDEVYLTLSGNEAQETYPVLELLQAAGTTIRIIPDWGNLASTSGATAITVGSQVLFSAADSPLSGFNIVLKELFDRAASVILLIIFAVPIGLIAVLIKLTDKKPVFYKQTRVGMNQKEFEIIKFRTMTNESEDEAYGEWTKYDDPRRTRLGVWLRKTSLDELPQLINVLKGQMSLVGPRPERPNLTKRFSEEYKKYMLRHKVKAGMTGLAQINGLRGDTSLRKRLLYDLYYVRNWSFWLDFWILLQTPWHIIKGDNAY